MGARCCNDCAIRTENAARAGAVALGGDWLSQTTVVTETLTMSASGVFVLTTSAVLEEPGPGQLQIATVSQRF
jgi:hypothetical protein